MEWNDMKTSEPSVKPAAVLRRMPLALLLLTACLPSHGRNVLPACSAKQPPAAHVIRLGMTTALSGPLQHLGLAMQRGVVEKLTQEACSAFWLKRRTRFELHVLDDAYLPEMALANTRQLITGDKVLALVGNVGTPTADRAWKVAEEAGVVFYGAYTGANILRRTPPARYVINYRASYDQEMAVIVQDIVRLGIPPRHVALLRQDDAFGQAGQESLRTALKNTCKGCTSDGVLEMRFNPNSGNVDHALTAFIHASPKPRAVIVVGGTQAATEFIRFAHRLSASTQFYVLSFTGATELSKLGPDTSARVAITQVVPPLTAGRNQVDDEVAREAQLATGLMLDTLRGMEAPVTSEQLRQGLLATERKLKLARLPQPSGSQQQMSDLVWLARLGKDGLWQQTVSPSHENK